MKKILNIILRYIWPYYCWNCKRPIRRHKPKRLTRDGYCVNCNYCGAGNQFRD